MLSSCINSVLEFIILRNEQAVRISILQAHLLMVDVVIFEQCNLLIQRIKLIRSISLHNSNRLYQ